MKFDAVGLGLCAWDRILLFDRYPGLNQKVEAIASAQSGGGPVPTALVIFTKLGGRAAFIGAAGDDQEGNLVRDDLERFGVDTAHLQIRSGCKTACAYIWVEKGTGYRTVALDRGEAESVRIDELPTDLLKITPLLLLDGRDPDVCLAAAKLTRDNGGQVVLDAGSPRPRILELLAVTDHAVISRDFVAGTFPGMDFNLALKTIQGYGPPSVVITSGEEGGYFRESETTGQYAAFPVEIVDTTGAGDAFHGGYLYGLKRGWDMPKRCRFAARVAADMCRGLGGRFST